MLSFNAILQSEGIDPHGVRLVRHQDTQYSARTTPYNLWKGNLTQFEKYQSIQKRSVFSIGDLLASFVATPAGRTLFVGLYSVLAIDKVPMGITDPLGGHDVGGQLLYKIYRDDRLKDFKGNLIIDWGKGFRSWVQRADKLEKPVLELGKDVAEDPFPGFREFCWDMRELSAVPLKWQAVLKSVKGVYLLTCKETGKQYVGSAKGEESLWGRFEQYAANGHGGNLELKRRGKKPYQVTVLEVVNSEVDIEKIESAWKRKLLSREQGLNSN